jgi:hypothetical protein
LFTFEQTPLLKIAGFEKVEKQVLELDSVEVILLVSEFWVYHGFKSSAPKDRTFEA